MVWLYFGVTQGVYAQTFHVERSTPILKANEMQQLGFRLWGDMPLGVIKEDNGQYAVFSPGLGMGSTQGTYKFVGSLDILKPAQETPSLTFGRSQPSPDGSDFDLDYAGGGPTYILQQNGKRVLLQIYHGEYHYGGNGAIFYSASGMAVSDNDGRSFTKIGEVFSPTISRDDFYHYVKNRKLVISGTEADGFMIEADENGYHTNSDYYYVLMSDIKGDAKSIHKGFSIARVKKSEALKAIEQGQAPQFKKYFMNGFTEPGIGGRSSFFIEDGKSQFPQVLYSKYLKQFVLCYLEGQKEIFVRTSDNLFHWSDPKLLFRIGLQTPSLRVFYPTMVGEGSEPAVLGHEFFLYFVTRSKDWSDAVLRRERITVDK